MNKSKFKLISGLALAMIFLTQIATVRADELNVPADGSASGEVSATFSVDDEILSQLGYNAVASVPLSLPLSYNPDTKKFANSGIIYCRGIVPEGKKITICVNETGLKYGKLYDPDGETTDMSDVTGFDISLTKNSWSRTDCYTNLKRINAGSDASVTGSISVTVPGRGFVPSSNGTYTTYVPLTIRQEPAP